MNDYYKIKNICKIKGGKRIPKGEVLQKEKNSHPYIRILDMYQGRIINISKDMLYAKESYIKQIKNYIVNENDVILAIVGNTLGMVSIIGNTLDTAQLTENCCKFVDIQEDKINRLFLYYALISPLNQNVIKKFRVGSSQPKLPLYNVGELSVPKFTLAIQSKISNLLSNIDSKIELNNKINNELESMAKTIYDYWFLQFEFPNEEGKPYKSSGGKMVWNEELKREIPEGWEVVNLSSCIKSINTGLNPRKNFKLNTGKFKYITVKNINIDGSIDFNNCDTIDIEALKLIQDRSKLSKGDILFASIAPLGRCYLLEETPTDWNINESVFSIRPNNNISSYLLYYYLVSDEFIKKATYSTVGSVFQGIRINTILNMKMLLPKKEIIHCFDSRISSLTLLKYKRLNENQELTKLRDFLLPLLMNGQVGFKEDKAEG